MHEEALLEWILNLKEAAPDVIENVDRKTLQVRTFYVTFPYFHKNCVQILINDVEHLAVLFYTDDCDECDEILEELETIDDDTDKQGNKHPANTKNVTKNMIIFRYSICKIQRLQVGF